MSLKHKKIVAIVLLSAAISAIYVPFMFGANASVRILPLRGPIATAKISPASGSATAYKMDVSGQKSVVFVNFSTVTVFVSSASSIGTDGFPLITKGSYIMFDLKNGTTVYFQGNTGGSDIRAAIVR